MPPAIETGILSRSRSGMRRLSHAPMHDAERGQSEHQYCTDFDSG